ncbi:MAG: hypothetical protein ACTHJZ_12175 [Trinickia sp.]|uniref:hypothetical protein n=1 Tax=Trinickia sp. TaxID=2571163 RepID=UPI003F7D7F96
MMLSLHEVAALLLVKDGHALKQIDRAELEMLSAHDLITLENRESTDIRARVTYRGESMLRAIGRTR